MELPIALQTVQFLLSALLGAGLGLWYDLLRSVRRRWGLTALLDSLFGLTVAVALLLFALTAGRGEFRLFFFGGIFCGAALYFLTVSPYILALWDGFWRILLISSAFLQKILKNFFTNIFSFPKK